MCLQTKMRNEVWDYGLSLFAAADTCKQIIYCCTRSSYNYQQNTACYKKQHKAFTSKFNPLSDKALWKPKLKNPGAYSTLKSLLIRYSLVK